MSRTTKFILFGVASLVLVLVAIAVSVEIFAPPQTVNAMGAVEDEQAPVTWQGWLTLAAATLGGAGLSIATVKEFLKSSLKSAIDLGRMQTIQWLIRTAKTPEAAAAFTTGARSEVDFMKETEFQLPTIGK